MIRCLTGEVLNVMENAVLLDVHGMGFDVLCTRGALALCREGERVRLTVFMQVSETGASLFGFADEREREIFLKVTAIKGVGGRTGMAILSVLSVDDILPGRCRRLHTGPRRGAQDGRAAVFRASEPSP